MYKSSEKFSKAIEKNGGRTFHPKLIFDGFELETEIHSLSYNGGSNGEDNITIGSAVSATLEIKMDKVSHLLTKQNFSFNLGILCDDGSYEFIPMGKFNAEKPETTDYEINVTAYDNMVLAERTYNSQLTYPTTTTAVMKEICNAIGVSFTTEIESITINNPSSEEGASNAAFAGHTMREAIGYIAGLYGKFAIFNRLGQLEFRWYEDSDYDVKLSKTYSFTKDEQDYSIDQLIVLQNQETTFKAGSGVNGISCSNPFATQSIVDAIYQEIGGFTFRKGTVKFLGDCRIDPWDVISVADLSGNTYKIPAMSISHSVDGGLTTTIESFSNSNADVSDTFSGPVTKAMERTYAQLLVVNKLIADRVTVDYVDANYVKTKELETVQATIENAVITNLQGKFASIEYLKANYATIESLSATIARVGTLETNSLTANSAVITQLTGGVANINTILFGSASGGSLSTEFSNSVVSLIGNAQIKSAMIESIDASKITALDINTTNVKVHSEDGKSQWKDNTIQISDNQRVRVQIGKDANADYNMYVWDKSGNLMFDAIGLTEKGINRPVIRNDMVKDDANISADKLDISSLFNVINNDGSHTLKSSKIFIDADKQTLDISFKTITEKTDTAVSDLKNLTSSVETVKNTVNAQGTQITNIQGQINTKIWQQDITTAVTSLQIGGRNLMTHSAELAAYITVGVGNYGGKAVNHTSTNYPSGNYTEITCTTAGTGFYISGQLYNTNGKIKQGDKLTLSGYIYCNKDKGSFNPTIEFGTNLVWITRPKLHQNWEYFAVTVTASKTVTTSTSAIAICFYMGFSAGDIVQISSFKLEKGTKATDWTPAPEDIDSSISTVEGKVTTVSNQYTSLNQSLTSLTATVNSNTTKINSKADGSTVTALQSNMTALTADLNGFKTTVSSTYSTKTEFNNLQVGGRNLLTKTNQGKTYWSFNKQNGTVSIESYETIGVKINCTVASTGYAVILYAFEQKQVNLLEPNMEYVLSFDLISSNTVAASVRICQPDATDMLANAVAFHVDAGTKWVHKSVTLRTNALTSDKSSQFIYITGFNKVGTVCFKNLKLEKGNKATDWTPAPEDVDSSIKSVATIANQTADKFQWIVKSGTSATDFTLTDRVATLLSDKFDITALTTFKTKAQSGTETVINGGAIKANTITADKIKVDSLQAISAKIGGFTIDNNNIASGTWGTSGSVMMCTGTDGAKSIGGSGTISGWCFTAGAKFGVTKTGSLYASDITVNGGKIDLNASSVTTAASSTTAYFRTAYSSSCYARISSGKDSSQLRISHGKAGISLLANSATGSSIYMHNGSGERKLSFDASSGLLWAYALQSETSLTCQSFSASGSATITGNITTSGKLTATGNLELRTSGNASNILLHDDYAKYCYIRYSGARLWFLPATDSGGFELGHSASLDANTGTFYATAWGSNSSRRYKENITELTESVADRLLKIKTYHFDYKKDYGNKDMYGVIAEEVEQVHKNAVLYRNGEPDAVDYTRFIPLLIKKVQMQDKKIKSLESLVAHLIGVAMNHS